MVLTAWLPETWLDSNRPSCSRPLGVVHYFARHLRYRRSQLLRQRRKEGLRPLHLLEFKDRTTLCQVHLNRRRPSFCRRLYRGSDPTGWITISSETKLQRRWVQWAFPLPMLLIQSMILLSNSSNVGLVAKAAHKPIATKSSSSTHLPALPNYGSIRNSLTKYLRFHSNLTRVRIWIGASLKSCLIVLKSLKEVRNAM